MSRARPSRSPISREHLLNSITEGICAIDMDGKIHFANPAFHSLFGESDGGFDGWELGPLLASRRLPPGPEGCESDRIRSALVDGRHQEPHACWFQHADGRRHLLHYSISPIHEKGRVVGAAALFRDLSADHFGEEQRRRREDELLRVARIDTLNEVATGIGHELHQPLWAIVNFAQGCARRIAKGGFDSSELIGALEKISSQAKRASHYIEKLRRISRRPAGAPEIADLNEALRTLLPLLETEAAAKGCILEHALVDHPLPIRGDFLKLQQVILNLVKNAAEAAEGESGHPIRVESRLDAEGMARISVIDRGTGIHHDLMPQIFDAFVSTKPLGTGMGLSIARSVIEAHEGRLWADPNPDLGMSFHFTLPLAQQPTQFSALAPRQRELFS